MDISDDKQMNPTLCSTFVSLDESDIHRHERCRRMEQSPSG